MIKRGWPILILAVLGCSEPTDAYMSNTTQPRISLWELLDRSDLIMVGSVEGMPRDEEEHNTTTFRINEVMASSYARDEWERQVLLKDGGREARVFVVQDLPFDDRNVALLPEAQYLLFLRRDASADVREEGSLARVAYRLVSDAAGAYALGDLTSLPVAQEIARRYGTLIDLSKDQRELMQELFGISDAEQLKANVRQLSDALVIEDALEREEELRRIARGRPGVATKAAEEFLRTHAASKHRHWQPQR